MSGRGSSGSSGAGGANSGHGHVGYVQPAAPSSSAQPQPGHAAQQQGGRQSAPRSAVVSEAQGLKMGLWPVNPQPNDPYVQQLRAQNMMIREGLRMAREMGEYRGPIDPNDPRF